MRMNKLIPVIVLVLFLLLAGCSSEKPFQDQKHTEQVKLYFGNSDATAVKGESREVEIPAGTSNEQLIKIVLEEIIKGPINSGLHRTIPPEVRVNYVEINGGTALVDFSGEMHTSHWGGAAGEAMTINSIVNTLTEFDFIDQVKITVEGQPLAIEHIILEEPLGRNEDMIEE